jgi:hypothetical protein
MWAVTPKEKKIYWAIMLCSPLKVNECFGGTLRLHLQKRKAVASRAAVLTTCLHTDILFGLFFNPEDGDDVFL